MPCSTSAHVPQLLKPESPCCAVIGCRSELRMPGNESVAPADHSQSRPVQGTEDSAQPKTINA